MENEERELEPDTCTVPREGRMIESRSTLRVDRRHTYTRRISSGFILEFRFRRQRLTRARPTPSTLRRSHALRLHSSHCHIHSRRVSKYQNQYQSNSKISSSTSTQTSRPRQSENFPHSLALALSCSPPSSPRPHCIVQPPRPQPHHGVLHTYELRHECESESPRRPRARHERHYQHQH